MGRVEAQDDDGLADVMKGPLFALLKAVLCKTEIALQVAAALEPRRKTTREFMVRKVAYNAIKELFDVVVDCCCCAVVVRRWLDFPYEDRLDRMQTSYKDI
jgi:hypothetical protein